MLRGQVSCSGKLHLFWEGDLAPYSDSESRPSILQYVASTWEFWWQLSPRFEVEDDFEWDMKHFNKPFNLLTLIPFFTFYFTLLPRFRSGFPNLLQNQQYHILYCTCSHGGSRELR